MVYRSKSTDLPYQYSAFTVKTNPANKGVRLRIRTDRVNNWTAYRYTAYSYIY